MKHKKQIVFIATPFGFGPTGKLYPIMQNIHARFDHELIYLTNELTSQIIKDDFLKFVQLDERSESQIGEFLATLSNPVVISSLNKFALRAAKSLDIPTAFIDGLTWLWEEIQPDFLLADNYYSLNFLGVDEKLKNYPQIKKVPYILDHDELGQNITREDFVLFHIGGFQNPLHNSVEQNYLRLLVSFFNQSDYVGKVVFAGGQSALKFLEEKIHNPYVDYVTLGKKEFQVHLKKCRHLITTSGLTTSLEAFLAKTPTSFLLPSNLSQYKILSLFAEHGLATSFINWDEFYPVKNEIWSMNESEALAYLDEVGSKFNQDAQKISQFNQRMSELFNSNVDTQAQFNFINKIGTNGAEVIVDNLAHVWQL